MCFSDQVSFWCIICFFKKTKKNKTVRWSRNGNTIWFVLYIFARYLSWSLRLIALKLKLKDFLLKKERQGHLDWYDEIIKAVLLQLVDLLSAFCCYACIFIWWIYGFFVLQTHLEASIVRHKAHIMKLELILRLLDNDELSPDQVNDVRDFLEDYVERNQVICCLFYTIILIYFSTFFFECSKC